MKASCWIKTDGARLTLYPCPPQAIFLHMERTKRPFQSPCFDIFNLLTVDEYKDILTIQQSGFIDRSKYTDSLLCVRFMYFMKITKNSHFCLQCNFYFSPSTQPWLWVVILITKIPWFCIFFVCFYFSSFVHLLTWLCLIELFILWRWRCFQQSCLCIFSFFKLRIFFTICFNFAYIFVLFL